MAYGQTEITSSGRGALGFLHSVALPPSHLLLPRAATLVGTHNFVSYYYTESWFLRVLSGNAMACVLLLVDRTIPSWYVLASHCLRILIG